MVYSILNALKLSPTAFPLIQNIRVHLPSRETGSECDIIL